MDTASLTTAAALPSPKTLSWVTPPALSSSASPPPPRPTKGMEEWCVEVQRITRGYFARLTDLTVSHLGAGGNARLVHDGGSTFDPCGGGGVLSPQLRAIVKMLQTDAQDNVELDVDVAAVEQDERRLLHQLCVHYLRKVRQDPPVRLAPLEEALPRVNSGEYTESPATVGAAKPGTADVGAFSPDSDTAAAVGRASFQEELPSSTSFFSLASPGAMEQVPADLLEIFRLAQSLSTRESAADGSSTNARQWKLLKPDREAQQSAQALGVLKAESDAEAAALALLCVRYFNFSKATTPAPVTATAGSTRNASSPQTLSLSAETSSKLGASEAPTELRRGPPSSTSRLAPGVMKAASRLGSFGETASPTALNNPEAWRKLIERRAAADAARPLRRTPSASSVALRSADACGTEPTATTRPTWRRKPKGPALRPLKKMEAEGAAAATDAATPAVAGGTHSSSSSPKATRCTVEDAVKSMSERNEGSGPGRPAGGKATGGHGSRGPNVGVKLPPLPSSAHPSTTAAAPPMSVEAASLSLQHTPEPEKVSQAVNMAVRQRPHRQRALPYALRSVVLPPNFSGLRGELMSAAQLEQLLAHITSDVAAAQAEASRQHQAAEDAAAELYGLQRDVTHVMLENVQLENDIRTLETEKSSGGGGTVAITTPQYEKGGVGGERRPVERRPLRLPPAPLMPASVGTHCTTALLLRGKHAKRGTFRPASSMEPPLLSIQTSKKNTGTVTAASSRSRISAGKGDRTTSQSLAAPAIAMAAAEEEEEEEADPHQDAHTILRELRDAIARREEERGRVSADIVALSQRIARHDTLLNATAEYWRRNAAVMKRQQFAVHSHPRRAHAVDVHTRLGGDGERWRWDVPIGHTVDPVEDEDDGEMGGKATGRTHRGSTTNTPSSATPPTAHFVGSPWQLQRTLELMEAVSATPPSRSLSFDTQTSPTATDVHSTPAATVPLAHHELTTFDKGDPAAEGAKEGRQAMMLLDDDPFGATEAHPSGRRYDNVGRSPSGRVDAAENVGDVPSSTLTSTAIAGTAFLGTPEPAERRDGGDPSNGGTGASAASDVQRKNISTAARQPIPWAVRASDESSTSNVGTDSSTSTFGSHPRDEAATVPLTDPGSRHRKMTVPSVDDYKPLSASSSSVVSRHRATKGSTQQQQQQQPHNNSFASSSAHFRRDEEHVLDVGQWRTIPALQLENLDEIAEFIYSVFERI